MIKKIIFIILLFCMSSMTFACIEPNAGDKITENTELCSGEFNMDEGLVIASDNIQITCQDTIIKGYDNEEAFLVANKDNITINGCIMDNFQIGVRLTNSDKITLQENIIKNNRIGLLVTEANENFIIKNTFENNTNFGVYLDNKSKVNTFRENSFKDTAFNVETAEDAPFNNYMQNNYDELAGPNGYKTDYKIPEDTKPEQDTKKGTETVAEKDYFTEPELTQEDIMTKVYEAKQLGPAEYIQRDLDRIKLANEKIDSTQEIKIDYDNETTTFVRTYKAKETVKNLQIYEHIPKSIAQTTDDLEITGKYSILKNDPLIMWEYEEVRAGQEVETSYKVNKVVKKEKRPENTVCLDCTKKKAGYSFIVPLLLIPIIVFGFIIFDRIQKRPE